MPDEVKEEEVTLEPQHAVELFFASKDEGTEDRLGEKKVLWKDILSEGRIEIAPVPGEKKRPFTVIASGVSDPANLKVSMTDIMQSYKDAAFKYVKIPMGHPRKGVDIASINTGFAEGLRIVKKNGKSYLQAALGFTEPDAKGKVERGTIPDVSSGILLNYTRKKDGRTFPAALHHIALTGDPIDTELDAFKRVYASDDQIELSEEDFDVIPINFADGEATTAEIVWNEQDGANWLREELQQALNPDRSSNPEVDAITPRVERPSFYVNDVAPGKGLAVADMYFKGDRSRWVIPYTVSDGKVSPAPEFRWTEAKEALIAASENFSETSSGKVKEGIKKSLVAMFGNAGKSYKVDEISLDQHALLRDGKGHVFLAEFALLSGGEILLSNPDEWEKKASPTQPKKKVVNLYDENTVNGRLAKARANRRNLINKSA